MLGGQELFTESDVTVLIFYLASMLTIPFYLPRHVPINYVTRMMHTATLDWILLKQTFSDEGIITVGFSFDLSANSKSLCPWYYCSWCLSQTFIPDMEFSMKNNEITCSKTKNIYPSSPRFHMTYLCEPPEVEEPVKNSSKSYSCVIFYMNYTHK